MRSQLGFSFKAIAGFGPEKYIGTIEIHELPPDVGHQIHR